MANTLELYRNGAVGFIDWVGLCLWLHKKVGVRREANICP